MLNKLKNVLFRSLGGQTSGLAQPTTWLMDALGSSPTSTGVNVTEVNSMSSTAIFAAVRFLAMSIGTIPLVTYKRLNPKGKEKAVLHPLYRILHDQANEEMTAALFRIVMMIHLVLWGNHFSQIIRNKAGKVIELWPLLPWATLPYRDPKTNELWYITTLPNGQQRKLHNIDVLHITGLSFDGLMGIKTVQVSREAIGLGKALEEYAGRFFGNGGNIGGVLEHPGVMSKEAQERLKESFEKAHVGLSKSHRTMVLEEGMKFARTIIDPKNSQALEGRKFQIAEVSRITGVPMHILAEMDKATFSNIEQQSIEVVIYTLRPWCVIIEQCMQMKLLSDSEKQLFFIEHLLDGLLRGDIKSRYESYRIGIQEGFLCADDIRESENLNPMTGGQGQIYRVPVNYMPAEIFLEYWHAKVKFEAEGGGKNGKEGNSNISDQ